MIQNRLNEFLSPVIQVGAIGFIMLTDAASLWWDPVDMPAGQGSVSLYGIIGTICIATLASTLMTMGWRSRVVVSKDEVEVVNPLKVYRFHLSQIEDIDSEFVQFP